ncbi:hypothetical protein HN51_060328 [Arachis hypogaea]|uniref:zinc finger CCHC domain-containing protein 8 n=1 Tax=Arachis ipaensis TaxID=130454 RepID=UPI0007AEF576|nr:zinc finger CCHC domain-containing protein 8 [Arachis ipaensis]XP_025680403.1 zinc finger CCHC domain-containing protein 8 [Arachis hypogaea]QHN83953.1 Zinc finger CCHC domain-containing protein [Arachis hypogaea]
MDSHEQLNEEMEMDMEMDSGSEGEKSRASNCVSGSLEDEKPPCQAEDSAEPAATMCGAPLLQVGFEVTKTVVISEEVKGANGENGSLSSSLKGEGSPTRNCVLDGRSILGAKRARIAVDEHQPSVHFVYNSLTRASRQKLEELLQQWSEWHAKHVSSSNDPSDVLESGEETFFPALNVGLEKNSAVSFWMDKQTRNDKNKDFVPVDDNSVPLYDRGYALGLTSADGSSNLDGGLEIVDDAARCFNCGSYSHSLRDCTRPRDSAAVNIARKQHKTRRNQNASSRNPTRYYQDSPTGKYAGLRPGALDDVTRQLLGLGELDPPPWLNRMRELGYPPGYLDVDDEDEPSGITIYTDREIAEQEDGEIVEVDYSKPKRKMTIEFPGINAPIPKNADDKLWAAGPSGSDTSNSSRTHHRSNYSSDYGSRGYFREQRSSGDFRDDGPPGDPGYGSYTHSFHPRYGGHDSLARSPSMSRSYSDGKRSPLHEEEPSRPFSFHSLHYSSSERLSSSFDRDFGRFGSSTSGSLPDRDYDRTSRMHSDDRYSRSWR